MAGIFISYRRADNAAAGYVHLLREKLSTKFGAEHVFMDIDTMSPGDDFVEVIENAISECDALIALIGPDWLGAKHEHGSRLDDPNDWVRVEVGAALKRKIPVIPALVGAADMPTAEQLPDDLQALSRRHGLNLSNEYLQAGVERLVDALEQRVRGGAREPEPVAKNKPDRFVKEVAWLLVLVAIGMIVAVFTINVFEYAFRPSLDRMRGAMGGIGYSYGAYTSVWLRATTAHAAIAGGLTGASLVALTRIFRSANWYWFGQIVLGVIAGSAVFVAVGFVSQGEILVKYGIGLLGPLQTGTLGIIVGLATGAISIPIEHALIRTGSRRSPVGPRGANEPDSTEEAQSNDDEP